MNNNLPWEPSYHDCKNYMELLYWKHRHQWYRSQAILLCVGIDPNKIKITSDGTAFTVPDDEFGPHEFDIDWYEARAERITNLLNQAIEIKAIDVINNPNPQDPGPYIKPSVFLQWLTDNNLPYPLNFKRFVEYKGRKAIQDQFKKRFYINTWSGVLRYLEREDHELRHFIKGKSKIIPVITEYELYYLSKKKKLTNK